MNYDVRLTNFNEREEVMKLFSDAKHKNPNEFTLVDVGGNTHSWAGDLVTHVIDIEDTSNHAGSSTKYFVGDISRTAVWNEVSDYVNKHGKFKFSTCTHTLEDISSVAFACEMISKISEQGFIAVPSKYSELRKGYGDNGHPWRGWAHHRWIFDTSDDKFVGYPKQGFFEHDSSIDAWSNSNLPEGKQELQFFWKDQIDFQVANNDIPAQSPQDMINFYKKGLMI